MSYYKILGVIKGLLNERELPWWMRWDFIIYVHVSSQLFCYLTMLLAQSFPIRFYQVLLCYIKFPQQDVRIGPLFL